MPISPPWSFRTLTINRRYDRVVPIRRVAMYSQALSPELADRMRRLQPKQTDPSLSLEPDFNPHGQWRCRHHGDFENFTIRGVPKCPHGCGADNLRLVPSEAQEIDEVALVGRDAKGRFLPRPELANQPPCPMTDDQIRAAAKRILSHCPAGTKRPLALACGFKGEWALHTLRGIAKGRGKLVDATRRRLAHTLGMVLAGELVPVSTGQSTDAGCPSHAWEPKNSPRAKRLAVPFSP